MPEIQDLLHLVATNVLLYGGSFLLVLGILVFVHEFGHYIVARWCGVRIDSFSIGFGREIWGYTDKRGTRWKFSLVPLGGYVKMFGDVDPASAGKSESVQDGEQIRPMTGDERKGAFFAKPVGQRFAIVLAGPAINYLFAILVLAGLYMTYGQAVTPPQAAAIMEGSAADKAGIEPHDIILSIGGRGIQRFEDVRREVMVKLDTPVPFKILRDGQVVELMATPQRQEDEDHHGFKQSRGYLGIISPGNGLDLKSIVSVDGTVAKDVDHTREMLLARMDKTFPVLLDRGSSKDIVVIHPLSANNMDLKDPASKGYSGLNIAEGDIEQMIKHKPIMAVGIAIRETYNISVSTLEALGQMVSGSRSANELGGIIRIGAIAGDMAKAGIVSLITFAALLSINLGLINLFPIPMLDGGHLVFYTLEALRGKPISEQIQEYAFRFGLVILVGIMIFANINDIIQLVL